jgi:hypothetical protein
MYCKLHNDPGKDESRFIRQSFRIECHLWTKKKYFERFPQFYLLTVSTRMKIKRYMHFIYIDDA